MATTAKTIPYPVGADNNDTATSFLNLVTWMESLLTEMTTTNRDAMAAGLKWRGRRIYNTTTAQFEWYNGATWEPDGWLRGEIKWLAYTPGAVPNGWLLCDGSVVSRTTYADLFAKVGTVWNTGGEAGTDFRLPNFKGRTIMGYDAADLVNYGTGDYGGQNTFVIASGNLPPHVHDMSHDHPAGTTSSDGIHDHWSGSAYNKVYALNSGGGAFSYSVGQVTHAPGSGNYVLFSNSVSDIIFIGFNAAGGHTHSFDVANLVANTGNGPGASTAIDNRPLYATLYPMIKT